MFNGAVCGQKARHIIPQRSYDLLIRLLISVLAMQILVGNCWLGKAQPYICIAARVTGDGVVLRDKSHLDLPSDFDQVTTQQTAMFLYGP